MFDHQLAYFGWHWRKKKCLAAGEEFMLVLTGDGSWLSRNSWI